MAIVKRELFQARAKMFIDRFLPMCVAALSVLTPCLLQLRIIVYNMVKAVEHGREELNLAMLWLITYTFLLRLPSEVSSICAQWGLCMSFAHWPQALLACKGSPDDLALAEKQTLVWREGDQVCIRILRRKNRPSGSGVLRRMCTCQGSVDMCAVHTLWDRFFERLPSGHEPWRHMTSDKARLKLREALRRLGIVHADRYGTHDFRRGHAEVCVMHIHYFPYGVAMWLQGHAERRLHAG